MNTFAESRLAHFGVEGSDYQTPDKGLETPQNRIDEDDKPAANPGHRQHNPQTEQQDRAADVKKAEEMFASEDDADHGRALSSKTRILYNYRNKDEVTDQDVDSLKDVVKDMLGWKGKDRDLPIVLKVNVSRDGNDFSIQVLHATTKADIATVQFNKQTNSTRVEKAENAKSIEAGKISSGELTGNNLSSFESQIKSLMNYNDRSEVTNADVDKLKDTVRDALGLTGDARNSPLVLRVNVSRSADSMTIEVEDKTTGVAMATIRLVYDTNTRKLLSGRVEGK